MSEGIYDPKKLTRELQDAKLPVASVASNGAIAYSRELTISEKKTSAGIIAMHDPAPKTEELRMKAYLEAGITIEKLIFAVWKELKSGDSSYADALKSSMDAVDAGIQ